MQEDKKRLCDTLELTLIPGIGLVTQGRLWSLRGDISHLFSCSPAELEALGVSPDACRALHSRRYQPMAEEILEWTSREGCQILLRGTPAYPELLEQIHDPPLVVYARGHLPALELPYLAIVGTRRPTWYGTQMAEGLATDLAQRGIGIVSGLARGIDAAAHRGCLSTGGRTIAVLGCGIDVVYPREHKQLTRKILESGLLLSEFPPGTSPSPQNFPVRNRVISGLALGTLIIEASEYSGSLITARLAMEQNREIFALPGNLTVPQSFGPNFLIKQGAKLVQSWRDIVEEFPPELRYRILSREETRVQPSLELDLLNEKEIRLLEAMSTDQATQFDRLFKVSGLEISSLSDLLLNLEMRGWIRQLPGNLYVKVARPKN